MERLKLENQLAKVEKEEMKIMKIFKNGEDNEDEPMSKSFEIVYNASNKKRMNQNRTNDEIIDHTSHNNSEIIIR